MYSFSRGVARLALVCVPIAPALAGTGSAHLNYSNVSADILMMTVRVLNTHQHTYYETLGWNGGRDAGGYTGIQSHNNGAPAYIFSIWDPVSVHGVPIRAVYAKPGAKVGRFGGEGEGLKYFDLQTKWTLGQPVTSLVRNWQQNGHTYFGMWTRDAATRIWTHHATFDFPVANIDFAAQSANSFIENWSGQAKEVTRSAEYYDVWARGAQGWQAINRATPTVTELTPAQAKQHAVSAQGRFVMQQGAPLAGFQSPLISTARRPAAPEVDPAKIDQLSAAYDAAARAVTVNWQTSSYGAPQFKYQLSVSDAASGKILAQGGEIAGERRAASLKLPAGTPTPAKLQVNLTVTDVLDRSDARAGKLIDSSVAGPQAGKSYRLQSLSSGLWLTIKDNSASAGAAVVQQAAAGQNQVWQLAASGDGYQLIAAHSRQCLDVESGAKQDGGKLIQWPCSGQANQRFGLKADGAGAYSLVGAQAGKCLDVANASSQAGQQLIQWSCHGGANQRWRLLTAE